MSEVLEAAVAATKEDQQRALRAEIDRSMALVVQALADPAFMEQNPHIRKLDEAIGIFATLTSIGSDDPQRTEKTRASLWNVVLTQFGAQEVPARKLTGPLADGGEQPRTLAQDAHLFPSAALVKDIADRISAASITFDSEKALGSVLNEISPLITADRQKREREAIQAADPLRGQTLDVGYEDPLAGQTLLDEADIAAAKLAEERRALELCVEARHDEKFHEFRQTNPGFVRVMEAIAEFVGERVSVRSPFPGDAEDAQRQKRNAELREKYEGQLCHFFLTRNGKISMEDGLRDPVTQQVEDVMIRVIEKLGEQIPARYSYNKGVQKPLIERTEKTGSARSDAKKVAAEAEGRVPTGTVVPAGKVVPEQIVARSQATPDALDCVRHFPQLVGREAIAQDTARNERAVAFVNGVLSIEAFKNANPRRAELAKAIEGYGDALAARLSEEIKAPDPNMETKAFFAARKERNDRIQEGKNGLVGALWGALLRDGQKGKFHLPTTKQTELALAFLAAPGLSAKPVADENGAITGYESRGESSPTAKLRESLNPAFEAPKAGRENVEKLKQTAEKEGELRALETELRGIIDEVLSSDATPDPDLSADTASGDDGVALPIFDGDAIAAARKTRGEAVSGRNNERVVKLRPRNDEQAAAPTVKETGRVSGIFAKAAAVALAVGTMFGIGGDVQKDTVAAAGKSATSWISSAFNFFRGAASSPVAPAYAAKEQESGPAPKP